jgi:hypothetical protein
MVPGAKIEGCSQASISESNLLHEDQRPETTVVQLLVLLWEALDQPTSGKGHLANLGTAS